MSLHLRDKKYKGYLRYLTELAASLERVREKLEAEWFVCYDGCSSLPASKWGNCKPDIEAVLNISQGVSTARNRLLLEIETELVAPIDADDIAVTSGIEAALKSFEEYSDMAWVAYVSEAFFVKQGDAAEENRMSVDTPVTRKWNKNEASKFYF